MLEKNSKRYNALVETLDTYTTLNLTGVGLIEGLYEARMARQKGPMCVGAAELILETVRSKKGPALIATGFPEGGGIPETDGPVGAAMLARALFLGLDTVPVIVTDDNWVECVKGACIGAGLIPLPVPASMEVPKIPFLRHVYIQAVPKDNQGCYAISDALLAKMKPSILFAIERPGMNKHGVYHGMAGRVLNELTADLDYLFRKGQAAGIPFVGFGDGGNELGTGVLQEDLPKLLPKAADCGCPCHGGIGSATAADCLVVSSVSNWGVTGVIAALALVANDPGIMHEAELEVRSIELCAAAGGVDGVTMGPTPAVDGISAAEWGGLIRGMKGMLLRGFGLTGDWRQLK